MDWDFFFPIPDHDPYGLYDWGASESPLFMGSDIWNIRASSFISAGKSLPQMDPSWTTFWNFFQFTPDTMLFYGESHSWAANPIVAHGVSEVWSFDAHHDLGYKWEKILEAFEGTTYGCDNWLLHFVKQKKPVHIRYPHWRIPDGEGGPAEVLRLVTDIKHADALENIGPIDRIFVCRSGAWVPSWCDRDYLTFIGHCPVSTKIDLGPRLGWPSTPRHYDQQAVEVFARQMKMVTKDRILQNPS